jgi:anaphase-promoting complex subunit 1
MSAVLFGRIANPGWALAPHTRNLGSHFGLQPSFAFGNLEPLSTLAQLTTLYMCMADDKVSETERRAHHVVQAMLRLKTGVQLLGTLPIGIAAPIREAVRTCQGLPPPGWSPHGYRLVDRNDLAEGINHGGDAWRDDGYLSVHDFNVFISLNVVS